MRLNCLQSIQRAAVVPTALCLLLNVSASAVGAAQPLAFGGSHKTNEAENLCDQFADPIPEVDPSTSGLGVDFNKINVAAALPACQEAASGFIPNPRYLALYGEVLRAARRYDEAYKVSEQAAARGNALAMMNLGEMYMRGEGLAPNSAESAKWYLKAANAGNPFAMNVIADRYMNGLGLPQSDSDAAVWYQKASDKGMPFAMVNLGYFYEYGRGVPQDYSTAAAWYHKAADSSDAAASASAMTHLGYLYENGHGVPQDYSEAVNWYRRAATGGDAAGMSHLGVMYQTGRGVERSFTNAAFWYQKAVDLNYDVAEVNLGALYQFGWGVEKNPNRALALYTQAARSTRANVAAAGSKLAGLMRSSLQPTPATQAQNTSRSVTSSSDDSDKKAFAAAALTVLLVVAAASFGNSNSRSNYAATEPEAPQSNSMDLATEAYALGLFDD